MHIAICDDEEYIRSYLRQLIEQQGEDCAITEFCSGKELLAYQAENDRAEAIDLLFLDITLQDMDGMAVARQLRRSMERQDKAIWGSLPLLIFVTGSMEHMQSAFAVNAFQYLVKPVKEPEFQAVFAQAVREYQHLLQPGREERKEILVKNKGQLRRIPADTVYYIESSNRKVILYLSDEMIEFYDKISELEQSLKPDFFRVHKGYLINMRYVEHYDRSEVLMKNGDRLLISKYKYHEFVSAYLKYISE